MVKALNKAAEKNPPLDLNKKTCEDINERLHGPYGGRDKLCIPPDVSPVLSSHG